ncbi:MAG: hypothetical protein ACFNYJ_04105, partial [Segatella oris]
MPKYELNPKVRQKNFWSSIFFSQRAVFSVFRLSFASEIQIFRVFCKLAAGEMQFSSKIDNL